jgi:hypothetical protein
MGGALRRGLLSPWNRRPYSPADVCNSSDANGTQYRIPGCVATLYRSVEEEPGFADFLAPACALAGRRPFRFGTGLQFPPVLRIAHSLEIGVDSFAYAAAIAFLLFPRNRERLVQHAAPVAHELPS